MPFHGSVYYPFTGDARSSAGIPSLLSSPLPAVTSHSGTPTVPPFKFRPRRESVDWRRIGAVDVDEVMKQLDVETLQEHIATVTFCSVEGERCQRCHAPLEPTLLKLLRLAQLTVEWLLHSQETLSVHLQAAEEKLGGACREREELLAQQKKKGEELKALNAELKQRKRVIRTQQSLLAPRLIGSQKCPHCEKSFLNSSFLHNHIQRRHPDQFQIHLQSEGEQKTQMDDLKQEIARLKEQIVQQQQAMQDKLVQEKEQQSMQKDVQKELERFKAEEMARMDRKLEDSREGIRREMEFLYSRNIQALNEANQSNAPQKAAEPPSCPPERDVDVYRDAYAQSVQKLEQQMKKQDKKWESRLQEINTLHESEKSQLRGELNRVRMSVSDHEGFSQRVEQLERKLQDKEKRLQEKERRLQEKEQNIRAEREQVRKLFAPVVKATEVPVAAAAQEAKQRKSVPEEPVCALKLDPIQETSEEERDSGGGSERKAAQRPKTKTGALRKNPNVQKEMRPDVKESFVRKLESLGIKPDQSGLKKAELLSIAAALQAGREAHAKDSADYWQRRDEILGLLEEKLRRPEPETRSKQAVRPRSSSLPSRTGPAPQPVPRTRTASQPKTSTPRSKPAVRASRTPPFSSDEAESDSSEEEAEPARPAAVLTRQAAVRQPSPGDAATPVTKLDSDEDDWSEVSELLELQPEDKLAAVGSAVSSIPDLARKLEQRFAEPAKRPPGGVALVPDRKDLQYSDVEDISDWAVSSLEERRPAPVKKSPETPSTSVWGTSTGKPPPSGTGSTLKSSLLSLGDFSDSDEQ